MKKSLSLLVAIAMVFSMFASVAAAATDTQGNYDVLKEAGIFTGFPDGSAGLDKQMTRAEFAAVIARAMKLDTTAKATFSDVRTAYWATEEIAAVAKAGYMEGVGANKFNPTAQVSVEQMATIAARLVGLEQSDAAVEGKVSGWAKGWVAAAIEAKLIPASTNYTVIATRGQLVDATFAVVSQSGALISVTGYKVVDAKNVEVSFSDKETEKVALTEALKSGDNTIKVTHKGKEYSVTVKFEGLAISKAEQTNTREITVTFNRALTDADKTGLTYEVKNGLITYTVTPTWAADNKSVVLSSTFLPAAEYDLTVKGFSTQKVKVEDEKAAKIEITTNSLQKAANQDLGIKLFNQFNKEIANPQLSVNVYNATQSKTLGTNNSATVKYDLSADNAKVDDNIVVTVTHLSGLSATKSFKVVAGSAATSIKLGAIAPLKDKTRITAGDKDIIVPVELTDQYGAKIKLAETSETTLGAGVNNFVISGITFLVSADTIAAYSVDKDGNLLIDTKSDKTGTFVINAINVSTGATGSTSYKVEGAVAVKTLQLSAPGSVVVAGEDVVIPFAAVDQFGGQVAGKDIALGSGTNQLDIQSNITLTKKYINAKGELVLNFAAEGTAYLYAYVNNAQVGSLTGLTVNKAAERVKVSGIKDVATTIVKGYSVEFDADNITYIDSYNRTKTVTGSTYGVSSNNAIVSYAGGKLVAGSTAGTAEITLSLDEVAGTSDEYKFNVTVVDASDVKSYSIKTIGTIYGGKVGNPAVAQDASSKYAVTVELVGKTSSGTEVAINQSGVYSLLTSSDPSVVAVSGTKIYGLKAGTSTVAAYDKNGTKLAEQAVTVSEAAPVAAKVEFDKSEYSVTGTGNAAVKVTVKDQYGVAITPDGLLFSSDINIATVSDAGDSDATTFTLTGVKVGTVTLTYISGNNVSGTATVLVNP